MADQEFLASFGVSVDETGLEKLQAALVKNRTLAEQLSAAFSAARASVQAFFKELEGLSMPSLESGSAQVTEGSPGVDIPVSLDFTQAKKDLTAFRTEAAKALKLSANGSAVVSAGRAALSSLQSLFSASVLPLHVQIQASGGAGNTKGGAAGAAGAARAALQMPPASPVTNNSSKTVQAPVSINVTAAGSSPEAVGRSVYDVAEQYLLRTLSEAAAQ